MCTYSPFLSCLYQNDAGRRLRKAATRRCPSIAGGQNIALLGDGTGLCQIVAWRRGASKLYEKRYRIGISRDAMRHLTRVSLLAASTESHTPRVGSPDEPRPVIAAIFRSGRSVRLSKWAHDSLPVFDSIYTALLTEVRKAQQTTPVYEGPYDPHWLPNQPLSPSSPN